MTHTGTGWVDRHGQSIMGTFGTPRAAIVSGHGSHLVDETGAEYLDLLGGIAVNVLGHAHPALVEAVTHQIGTLEHASNFFATPPQVRLAERLLALVTPGGAPEGSRVFLTNSGTESNECALKIARAHANAVGGRPRILALEHAFHGRSTGALALTWKEAYRAPFAPLIDGVEFIPAGDEAALEAAMGDDVAALFVEPIQGEAGVHEVPDSWLQLARELTSRHGALLVVDEVQTGMGRTGDWMGFHRSGIVPDVVTLAKGLAGGLPAGACIALGEAGVILGAGMHGSTFGGNPVCAAAGNAVLDVLGAPEFLPGVADLGRWWREELSACGAEGLVEVRGRGLLIGLEFDAPVAPAIVEAGAAAGFILNATGPRTLRLAPPLVLTREEAATFTSALPGLVSEARASVLVKGGAR